MRASRHNSRTNAAGRVHGRKHNDRNFDLSKASNINADKAADNLYENYYNDLSLTFEDVEKKFYKENFSAQLAKINNNYIKNRHPERCKEMDDWMRVRQNAPEETFMQIGKMEKHVKSEILRKCFETYDKKMKEWNDKNGNPYTILNRAYHFDEAVPHVQERRVWHYRDKDGILKIGQEKALMAAGVELPDPNKKPGQYNNRKMTFDAMAREIWLDACYEHGIEVEREPVPDGTHNLDKEDMIRKKNEDLMSMNQNLENRVDDLSNQITDKENQITVQDAQISAQRDEITALEQRHLGIVKDYDEALEDLMNEYNDFDQLVSEEIVLQMEELRRELGTLSAKLEDLKKKNQKDYKDIEQKYQDLNKTK